MKNLYLISILLLSFSSIKAQSPEFQAPLDIPLILSGNFAELRTDHFHSGLDFKTQGVTGLKVRAVDDAYVSRIKIQTNGYGNSVYLSHPGGYTTLYGHLSAYTEIIAEYVKTYQYKNESHTLDLYPGKNEITFKKGDVIAYSGNTGSSSGPHLHFEMRNTATQHPLNVLNYNFKVEDSLKPKLFNLYTYSIKGEDNRQRIVGSEQYNLTQSNGGYKLANLDTIEVNSNTGFGLEVFDFLNGAANYCGIYTLELFVNDAAVFTFKTDEFSFAESRYINSQTDYERKANNKKLVYRLFKMPNNRLSMLKYQKDNGIISFDHPGNYKVEIKVSDVAGNKTSLNFYLKSLEKVSASNNADDLKSLFYWDQPNDISNHLFKLNIPSARLYQDANIKYSRILDENKISNWIHTVGEPGIPMHRPANLSLNIAIIDTSLLDKLCIVSQKKDGSWDYIGGKHKNAWVSADIYNFGTFTVDVDTIPPLIKMLKISKSISFHITDDLSGIDQYKGYIDNEWVLFEYDPKNDLLKYIFDAQRISKNTDHEIELYISDRKGNTSLYHHSFYW